MARAEWQHQWVSRRHAPSFAAFLFTSSYSAPLFSGGHNIRYNRDIEEWNAFRENTHRFFVLNRRNTFLSIIYAGVIPFCIYKLARREQVARDVEKKTPHDYI